jgi:hypothetical protein
MGSAAGDLEALRTAVLGVAVGSQFSAEEIGAAFGQIAQDAAGLAETPEQLAAITRAATTLATAARTELPAAADAVVQLMRQFSGTDAQSAANVVVELGSSIEELADTQAAFQATGAAAAQLGVSLPEAAAALQLLGAAGIEGAQAGAALRGVLQQLEAQGGSLAPSVVGLAAALDNAAEANVKWTGEALAAGRVLTQNAGDFRTTATAIAGSDAAARLAAGSMDTFEGSSRRLAAAWGTLSTQIGGNLTPGLSDLNVAATGVLTTWSRLAELEDPFDDFGTSLPSFGEAIRGVGLGMELSSIAAQRLWLEIETLAAKLAARIESPLNYAAAVREIEAAAAAAARELDKLQIDALGRFSGAPPEVPAPGGTPRPPPASGTGGGSGNGTTTGNDAGTRAPRFGPADGLAFMAEASIDLTEDPLARLNAQFAAELAAYAAQGAKLVEAGVLSEDERARAILARRDANERELTARSMDAQVERANLLREFAMQMATSEAEAAQLQLDDEVQGIYQRAIELGLGEQAAQQAALDARTRGQAAILAAEKKHSADLKAAADARWRQEIQGAITGGAAILSLFAGNNEKAFQIQKIAAIASATLNVYASASEAYRNAAKNPAQAAVMAGLAASAQLAQVVAIRGVTLGGGGGGGGAAVGGGGSVSAPSTPVTGGSVSESPFGDAPSREIIRNSERFPTFPAASASTSVVVNNFSGKEVEVDERRGPSGEQLIDIVVGRVAQDIANNGPVGQVISKRYGSQPRLGLRA